MSNHNFTKKKLSRIVFHVLLFTLFLLTIGTNVSSVANPLSENQSSPLEPTPWQVSQSQSYLTAKAEHRERSSIEIQYTKSFSNCDASLLNLSVRSSRDALNEFRDQVLVFRVRMNEHDAIIKIPASVIATDPKAITLRPFLINEQLQSDLLTHKQIKLELLAPEALVERVDEPKLLLSLASFQKTHQQMMEFFAVVAKRNDSITHYALHYDVL